MKIGILGTADIAFRRFLPALALCPDVSFAGVASRTREKTRPFLEKFGGRAYPSYDALLADPDIDAVYVPLPPALHFEWGRKVLLAGKHLLMEKPFTVSPEETRTLLDLAEERHLAVHENYMFLYHSQLAWIEDQLRMGVIGDLRLVRAAFGFPFRGTQDFRYNKALGGGALLDCGGYPVRLGQRLLGPEVHVTASSLCKARGLEVDVYGSATLENSVGQTAQISFGMDNSYKCELELWGSRGCLIADRIFTAPPEFSPTVRIQTQDREQTTHIPPDNAFLHSLQAFLAKTRQPDPAPEQAIYIQSALVGCIQKEGIHDDHI